MEFVECAVIGAGVVGLAVARALARRGYETVVIEAERVIGSGISSRNSEVIHAGIYYQPGSLKSQLCVQGRRELYAFCDARQVPYRRCGKLIVATSDARLPELMRLRETAIANGVDDVRMLSAAQALRLESELRCVAAIESPSTGIVDAHSFMLALRADAEAGGAAFGFGARVAEVAPLGTDVALRLEGESSPSLKSRLAVNAAGLGAISLANSMSRHIGADSRCAYYAKGNYFRLRGRSPFARLVYPLPEDGGLGVHVTLDLGGQSRFGPDVEWIQQPQFEVDPARARRFEAAVRTYWPGLPADALIPAYAGVRPKLTPPGAPAADFRIEGPADLGGVGLINLLGIESPGLTASLAIADRVASLAGAFL